MTDREVEKVRLRTRVLRAELKAWPDGELKPHGLAVFCEGTPSDATIRRWLDRGEASEKGVVKAQREHVRRVARVLDRPLSAFIEAELSDGVAVLLDFAAACGPRFYPELAPFVGLDSAACQDALAHYLIEEPDSSLPVRRYRFPRWSEWADRVREGATLDPRQATNVLRWARANGLSVDRAPELHYMAERQLENWLAAIAAARAWVEGAYGAGMLAEAAWVGARALKQLPAGPEYVLARHRTLILTSGILRTVGRAREARALLTRDHALYFHRPTALERYEFDLEFACVRLYCGQGANAVADADRALAAILEHDESGAMESRMWALKERLHLEILAGGGANAERTSAALEAALEQVGGDDFRVGQLLAIHAQSVGDMPLAEERFLQALQRAYGEPARRARGLCRFNLGVHFAIAGRFDDAVAYFEQALTDFRSAEAGPLSLAMVKLALGEAYFDLGDAEVADDYLRTALKLQERYGAFPQFEIDAYLLRAEVALGVGDTARALTYAHRAAELASEVGRDDRLLAARCLRAAVEPPCPPGWLEMLDQHLGRLPAGLARPELAALKVRLLVARAANDPASRPQLEVYADELEATGYAGIAGRARRYAERLRS